VAKNWKADGSTIATNVLKVSSDTDGSTGTASADQGCQIYIGTAYQNRKSVPNHHKIYQMAVIIPNDHNIFQTTSECTYIFHSKSLQNVPKLVFWYAIMPSGNPEVPIRALESIWNE
jgi:hypothetical protein